MSRSSRALRATCLAALPVLLLAASWAPLAQQQAQSFDPFQFRTNRERWGALPESRRDELRSQWARFSELSPEQRELASQRMEYVRRLVPALRRILGREPLPSELAVQLDLVRQPLSSSLAAMLDLPPSTGDATLRAAAEREIDARIDSLLDGLVADGKLAPGERVRIMQLTFSLKVRDGLAALAAAGGVPAPEVALADDGAPSLDDLRLKAERDGLENARKPEVRGGRSGDARGGDPIRQRLFKMTYVVGRMKAEGHSMQEIQELMKRPIEDLDRYIGETLEPR